jgi:endonuclease/exonuclease/phosphatase family metal-dependent hydrolase
MRAKRFSVGASGPLLLVFFGLLAATGQLQAQTTLRVAAYNVKHGLGMDSVIDLERIASVLRPLDADVITLQEIDEGVERSDRVRQATALGALLGMSAHFGDFMPYQGGEYGMAVLTRLPVASVTNHRLPDGDEPRTALEVQVAAGPDGSPVSVVGIHFYRTPEERLAQAEMLSELLADREHPVVLAGDFNSRRGDVVLQSLLESDWFVVDKDGPANTFPSDSPAREIDFVMLRPGSAFEVVEHRVIEESVASDHRPMLVVLRIW